MIQVTKTYLPQADDFHQYTTEIMNSCTITNHGKMVQTLTSRLEAYLGVKNLLLVSNGTLALQVAYKLLGLRGEVITTPFSFVATTSSLVWEGLTPVFADIDEQSFNMDPKEILKKITPKTSAIVPVHVFGNPCEYEAIEAIAKKHHLKVIYDAAHCFDVQHEQASILNQGDISMISFHATKIFHTIEGGALIIQDDQLYEQAKKMINFGICGEGNIECLGINAKMNEFQAAMGLSILDDIQANIQKRKRIHELYDQAFEKIEGITTQTKMKNTKYNYAYYPIVVEDTIRFHQILTALKQQNYHPRRYFYPALNTIDYLPYEEMPNAEYLAQRILCLPLYDSLEHEDVKNMISIIQSVV